MQVALENTGVLARKLTVHLPAENLETSVRTRIAELGRTVRLKGFRPGRVPPQVIQKRFGAQVRNEALNDLVGKSLRDAFEQEHLEPVAQPDVDTTGEAVDGQIAVTATFEVMPQFPDIDVSALEVKRPVAEVGDADIDAMIDTLRKQRQHFKAADAPAAEGDLVTVDYVATLGDYRFPEQDKERAAVVLGAGGSLAMLEPLLSGHKAGEQVAQDVEFPAGFTAERLAGRSAHVEVDLVKVEQPVLPEVNAEFIKQFGVVDGDLETFRKEIRANLERELKAALMARLKAGVVEQLAATYSNLDVPEVMLDGEVNALLSRQARPSKEEPSQGAKDEAREVARKRVAAALIMGEIARREKLELDRKRLGQLMNAIASTYEEPEQVIALYNQDERLMAGLQNRVMEDQVTEWVAEHAKCTDEALSFDTVMRPQ